MANEANYELERQKSNTRYEFSKNYKHITSFIIDQFQRGYSRANDYFNNVFKIKDSKSNHVRKLGDHARNLGDLVEKQLSNYRRKNNELAYQH